MSCFVAVVVYVVVGDAGVVGCVVGVVVVLVV